MIERTDTLVIGAGWAGLSAAVRLCEAGVQTAVVDAAPQVGGRARQVSIALADKTLLLDNGQHLLIGAYRECLDLARTLQVQSGGNAVNAPGDEQCAWARYPLELRACDGLVLQAGRGPAPMHLLAGLITAEQIPIADRLRIVRLMVSLRLAKWRARPEESVSAMFVRLGQSDSLCERFWNPLVLGAMNTLPEFACANTFARVLGDSLGSQATDSDFVLPKGTLSDFLPSPAVEWLRQRGARIGLRTPIKAVAIRDGLWRAQTGDGEITADRIVLAVPPYQAADILETCPASTVSLKELIEELRRFEFDSIATAYLAWPASVIEKLPRWLMLNETADAPGQWLFDRGEHQGLRIASVIVSACSRYAQSTRVTLGRSIADQVARQLQIAKPVGFNVLIDKRATLRCTVSRPRILTDAVMRSMNVFSTGAADPWARIALAGDYAYPDYPATLEAAVRSGKQAANLLISGHKEHSFLTS